MAGWLRSRKRYPFVFYASATYAGMWMVAVAAWLHFRTQPPLVIKMLLGIEGVLLLILATIYLLKRLTIYLFRKWRLTRRPASTARP